MKENHKRILFVEDDRSLLETFSLGLEAEGYQVDAVSSTVEAMRKLADSGYAIVVTDIYLDEHTGLDVLKAARGHDPRCAVIVITGQGTMETVMEATERGAFDYIAKPFDLSRLLDVVRRAEKARNNESEPPKSQERLPDTEMVGFSAPMVEIYKTISRVAPTDAPVLIEGESGTGKELVARLIHKNSRRAGRAFLAVDCGSIAPGLMESELFGAVRGAFTGADRDRTGLLEAGSGGTVFLDEIAEVEGPFQLKLLRFLQEKEVRPLGSPKHRKVDVRILAATNRDLQAMVEEGTFRKDLWFRLNVVHIQIPPLRERRSDIAPLTECFLEQLNTRYERAAHLMPGAMRALEEYSWPGNVRQLEHLLERLVILSSTDGIEVGPIRQALATFEPSRRQIESLADAEEEQIRKVLAATGGNKSRAAEILNIERKTLYRKLDRMKR